MKKKIGKQNMIDCFQVWQKFIIDIWESIFRGRDIWDSLEWIELDCVVLGGRVRGVVVVVKRWKGIKRVSN